MKLQMHGLRHDLNHLLSFHTTNKPDLVQFGPDVDQRAAVLSEPRSTRALTPEYLVQKGKSKTPDQTVQL